MIHALIIAGILLGIAAICNAAMDVLAFKFKNSIFKNLNHNWWNPAKSWKNKYKDKMVFKGPAFIGSTTLFSFITDAWHLFRFLNNTLITIAFIVIIGALSTLSIWKLLALLVILKLIREGVFKAFYKYIFRKK